MAADSWLFTQVNPSIRVIYVFHQMEWCIISGDFKSETEGDTVDDLGSAGGVCDRRWEKMPPSGSSRIKPPPNHRVHPTVIRHG